MAELKGQLLGIVLVIMAFAAIGSVLVNNLKQSASDINSRESAAYSEITKSERNNNNNKLINFID